MGGYSSRCLLRKALKTAAYSRYEPTTFRPFLQVEMSKLSERYYVLCKKADQRVKNFQHLMIEWQRLVSGIAKQAS
jgi:hypothetical protein